MGILIVLLAVVVVLGIAIDISGANEHPRPPRMMNMMYRELPKGDWIAGRVSDISTSSANIEVQSGGIKTLIWDKNTKFPPPFGKLKPGDFIRAVGEDKDGAFYTKFIGYGRGPVNFKR